jgi:hypothetical protein
MNSARLYYPEFEHMSIEHPTMKMAAKDEVTNLVAGVRRICFA